jgi:peptide/nickel transport system ATP-binding protein
MEVNTNGDFVEKKTDFGTLYGGTAISKEEIELENKKRTSSTPILRVRNLKTYFHSNSGFFTKNKQTIKAVDDVSFDVYPGETLGLVGESGCGKTTLGRSILRLIDPQSGEIHFDEKDLMKLNASETRKIRCDFQIIFQDPYSSLNPKIKVGEAVLEPLNVFNKYENKKARKEKVIELFETVGLNADYYNRYPHEFSGGQRQRICIARALALQPKFIVCDESVSALDVSVQAQILNLLNELKSNFGLTYIFISHDLSVIHHIADRIAVMKEGKILEMGTPHQIFNHSHNEYTQGLIDAIL